MLDSRLSYVIAVARNGSFTAAAAAVGITQSAVTRSVAELERELGYPLFYRSAKGALLTEKGRDFVDRAERIVESVQDLLHGAARPEDPYATVLRIGVCPASLEWLLAEPLVKLHQRHPSVRYEVSASSFERMVRQLLNGSVEVAVGFDAAFADWPEVKRVGLGELETTFFVRRGHPILSVKKPAAKQLAKYEIISTSISRPYLSTTRGIFESQGMDWRRHIHTIDSFAVTARLVAYSDAIGVVSRSHAKKPSFRQHFETLEPMNPYPSAAICAATRGQSEPPIVIRALINALRSTLTSKDGPLAPTADGPD